MRVALRLAIAIIGSALTSAAWAACPDPDTTPPTVSITDPHEGDRVRRRSSVVIQAVAMDNVAVQSVEITVNGQPLCADTTAPYQCFWAVPEENKATYVLQATAKDTSGNTAASALVHVTS